MVNIDIENIIASANLNAELELEEVTSKLAGSEYNPERFPGVIYRSEDPKVVILVFKNGRMMCTAARSLEDVEKVMNQVEGTLKSAGLLDKKPTPKPEPKAQPEAQGEAPSEESAPGKEAPAEAKAEEKPKKEDKAKK